MTDSLRTISTRRTAQTVQAAPGQIKADGGGFTFEADPLSRLRRFLAMGVEGGTFYVGEKVATERAGEFLLGLVRERPAEVLDVVLDMSQRGATVKQEPLMLTFAALAGCDDTEVRARTLSHLPDVARTASHLFLFLSYVPQFRGWGKGLRKAVARWYVDRDLDGLGYQMAKYGNRYGFTHRDALRLAHVGSEQSGAGVDSARAALLAHAAGKAVDLDALPSAFRAAERLSAASGIDMVLGIINETERVSWEMVPSEYLGDARVWQALLDGGHVPMTALLRNLARLTTNGTLDPFGQDDRTARVIGRLRDSEALTKARVHPMSVLLAAATYASGRSLRGDSTWRPIPNINKALDAAFPAAFGSIVPEPDVRVVIGVDTSQSMDTSSVAGLPMSCRTAAVALAQALAAQFPRNMGMAFTGPDLGTPGRGYRNDDNEVRPFDVDPDRRLTDVIAEAKTFPFGSTDCALPVLYAAERGLAVDCFIVLTDNETWAGKVHPHQALRAYRESTGIPARMVTVAMQQNRSTIADPSDPLMLDVVGLDSNVVSLVGEFAAGRV